MNTIKNIVLILSLLFYSTTYAYDGCDYLKDTAMSIMKYRQSGASFDSLYSIAVKNDSGTSSNAEQIIVRMSFSYPRIYDMDARAILIEDFGNKVYNICNRKE